MNTETIPIPQRLALNYARVPLRQPATALFALDARLGEFVSKANEPMLAQMRLAWWRDELGKPVADRAKGDPVLDELACWAGEEPALVALVDGWERLMGDAPLPEDSIAAFAGGRAESFAALARLIHHPEAAAAAHGAGTVWALADFAARVTDERERITALDLARDARRRTAARLPRILRPLAVLQGLSFRALGRSGGPLVAGRGDVLAALRLGMFGR